jgi:hypothetical protein
MLLTLMLLPGLALAQTAAPSTAPSSPATYPDWEHLTPAQRDVLIAPLRDRWDTNPGERSRMFERAQRWQQLPPEQRKRAHDGIQRWDAMTPMQREQARALFHALRGMSKDERRAFLQQWQTMTPQERADWARTHPAPQPSRPAQAPSGS